MAFDCFVRIDTIQGESADAQHLGWMEVYNFRMGIGQTVSRTTSTAGGASVERADFKPLNFVRPMDQATPQLALACAQGRHIGEIVVEVCRAGGEQVPCLTCRLNDCLISRVMTIGGGNFPVESVDVNYGRIEWRYHLQTRDNGGAVGRMVTGWNLERNCKL